MYSVQVDRSPVITVNGAKHAVSYAVDGSQMNPLEAFYATLAGCAAVFAKKACKELGISPEGIHIACRPFAGAAGPLSLSKFKTEVRFPEGVDAAQKAAVLEAIKHCAVKQIVEAGAAVDFQVAEG
ncbi:MAG TPA: OsmC family protein [Rhodocyclaceae bacterium]|nr:OsmC family protein [Rhodocyclaceae bacterium]HND23454.1 OsmC family protein [Rhodocyclaceae bacterium]HNE15614.1 OsmC family protein [Rhodocyclaceae bacterium]HNI80557.1 OsmC family protein [Rhodocyclaceae bacterium]